MMTEIAVSQRSHNVTIIVPAIIHSAILPAALSMTIDGAGAVAGDPMFEATDQSSVFYWATNRASARVTVATNLGAPNFRLYITPLPSATGTYASEFLLTTTATPLVTDIGLSRGSCTIRYRVEADATVSGGSQDVHQITFTLTSP